MRYVTARSCFVSVGSKLCALRGLQPFTAPCGTQITNEMGCPLFELSNIIFTVSSMSVLKAVSLVHECAASCKFSMEQVPRNVERELVSTSRIEYKHDFTNLMYCFDLYCIPEPIVLNNNFFNNNKKNYNWYGVVNTASSVL